MKKILFIEDEAVLQKTFSDFLQKSGYQIISALDGEIGLRRAQEIGPDLIFLDLVLPKLHGFEVLKKLKENPKTKDIPVIILTNLENAEEVDKALDLGATTYLVKPHYTLNELVEKVNNILK